MKGAAVAMLLLALSAAPAAAEVTVTGEAVQGGLVQGRTEPGASVALDGKPVPVGENGGFLLGFGRDAAPQAHLTVRHADGATEERLLEVARRDWDIQRIDGLPEKQVTPDPALLERIKAEAALIAKARERVTPGAWAVSGFSAPAPGRVSGVFGSQRILNGEPRSPHSGTDIAAPQGTPVAAAADGTVSLAQPDLFYTGRTVMVDHGQGLASVYAHLSEISVREGQAVRRGEIIGRVGASGRATGPHLHWGVSWFDVKLDPELVLRALPPLR